MDWSTFLVLLLMGLVQAEETCLSAEEDPYLMFGSKTSYVFATSHLSNSKAHDVPGCEPKAFWMLDRQGSHNPETEEFAKLQALVELKANIAANLKSGNFKDADNRMCPSDLKLLTEMWEWNSLQNVTFAGDLTGDGYLSTQQLAQAFKQKFPGLLTATRHNYLFKFGSDSRSKNTFQAFTEGIFGAQAEGYDIPKENDEKLIYPYKSCPAWSRDIEQNKETLSQKEIFESKLEFREMYNNISQRLGFKYVTDSFINKYEINSETIKSIYEMCRYNKAWDVSKISPWCAAFSREDLKRLEYSEDLETYYKYGYGSTLHEKIGCLPVKDMYSFFSNHVSEEISQQPLSMITFTDYPMLMSTLAALKTRQDSVPLTGDNYRTPTVQGRKWTTSTMAPFNGNVAAILYKCTPNGNFQIKDTYQVLFLENERPMFLEDCRVGLCDWSLVKQRYGELIRSCDLDFCNSATKSALSLSVLLALIVSRLLV